MVEKFMIEQSQEKITEACELARELHKDQVRKGTKTPYFEHVAAVALLVKSAGGSNHQIIAAFLHDAIEDQGDKITYKEIEQRFGSVVTEIVYNCSEDKNIKDWHERKRKKIDLFMNDNVNPLSHLVALCDKLHNAESIINDFLLCGDLVWDRFKKGPEDTLWWYKENLKIFHRYFGPRFPLLKRYENAVFIMEKIAERRKDEIQTIKNFT